MAKEWWLKKKEDKQQCFKYDKEGYIAKDCKGEQSMKKRKVQEESDNDKDEEKGQGFGNNLKQAWYKRSPMYIPRINILFQIIKIVKESGN